jgi:hypothetical protein
MWWLEGSSVILILGAMGACAGGLCFQMRHSRCEKISLCCGAFRCERKIMTLEEQDADSKAEERHHSETLPAHQGVIDV